MFRIAEFVTGLAGGMAVYFVGTFLLDQWITGTTLGDTILTQVVPAAIGAGIVIGILVHVLSSPGGRR